jgi:hypothetical protein
MPAAVPLPSTETLRELFEYRDGSLYWKATRCAAAKAGEKAGCINRRGYLVVGLNFKKYLVHRIVWVMHGNEPAPVIDHINGNTLDNRIENLRSCTHQENMRNSKRSRLNTSGIKGVSWSERDKKWVGYVQHQKKLHRVGAFASKTKCAAAVSELREKLHGAFARH